MITAECIKLLKSVLSRPNMNETQLKETFVLYLIPMFPDTECRSRLEAFPQGAEEHVVTLTSSETKSTWGFIDTLHGKLVIEFKANLAKKRARREGILELRRYVSALWTQHGPDSSFCGVLTDVLRWELYRPVPTKQPKDGKYNADMVSLELVESVKIEEATHDSAQSLLLLLKRILIDENLSALSAENLLTDFGDFGGHYSWLLPEINKIVAEAAEKQDVELLLSLWRKYQYYNAREFESGDEYYYYSRQVYVVLLSRILVAILFTTSSDMDSGVDAIRDILTGRLDSVRRRITNLVVRDFFGWITDAPWIDRFIPIALHLYHGLRSYDFTTAREQNVLRLVYDNLLPETRRDELGQHSTPEILAKEIVSDVLEGREPPYRCLDPACGSGTFLQLILQETLSRLDSALNADEQLRILVDTVTGIDIDPVAVTISKAVWAMTLSDLLNKAQSRVTIPVYLADSLFLAKSGSNRMGATRTQNELHHIVFDDTRIAVPGQLLDNMRAFDKFVIFCNQVAKRAVELHSGKPKKLKDLISETWLGRSETITQIAADINLEEPTLASAAESFVYELACRIIAKRNGVWAFVVSNSYRPSFLAGRFDIIVTNPPWLTMSSLSEPNYENQLKLRAGSYSVIPAGQSFLHLEIATTFLLHSVSHFLRSDGVCAFVLTRSIFDGDNHDPFRRGAYSKGELPVPLVISKIWDLESVENLFRIPSCIVFGRKGSLEEVRPDEPIPGRIISSLPIDASTARDAIISLRRLGTKTAWSYSGGMYEDILREGHYRLWFRQGADLMPRTALFVETVTEQYTLPALVEVQTSEIEVNNRLGKVLKGRCFRGLVNSCYLFRTVTSNVLLPFHILDDKLPLVLLPVKFVNGKPVVLSSMEQTMAGHSDTAEWFDTIDDEPEIKDNKIGDRIDYRGKLTRQEYTEWKYLVHYGASGKDICAAVQTGHRDLDFPFIADQTTYVYGTNDEREASYIAGVLNAPVLNDRVRDFQAKGLFGARHIHKKVLDLIPEYEAENNDHKRITGIALSAATKAAECVNEAMTNLSTSLGRRRRLLREEISDELSELNPIVEKVLDSIFKSSAPKS